MVLWIQFFVCSAVIFFSGKNLSQYGDIIAERTGLGRTWIGVLLLASVTSLPELITGASSAGIFDLPDIAGGNIIGACMLNLLTIAFLDLLGGPTPISARAQQGLILPAGFAIVLLGIATASIALGARIPSIGWVGLPSLLFVLVYFAAMRTIFVFERRRLERAVHELAEEAQRIDISRARAYGLFAFNAALIVGAGMYLPTLGEGIAETTGLGQTFVGSVFVAISTTLPELTVSATALRMGAVDMSLGNLFGSNLFNVTILAVDDLVYLKGPLLADVSAGHLVTGTAAMIMTAIAIIGLTYRAAKKPLLLAWDAMGILLTYAGAMLILYQLR